MANKQIFYVAAIILFIVAAIPYPTSRVRIDMLAWACVIAAQIA